MSANANNLLIAGLAAPSRAALMSAGEPVTLRAGETIYGVGERIEHAYFPFDAAISLAAGVEVPQSLGVGVVGIEGMLGIGLILDSPVAEFNARVQTSGRAWRVTSAHFRRQLDERPAFRARMNRYAYVCLLQLAQDITCRNFHLLEGRLARQLLMARDRSRSNRIALTHASLATLLGVRRAGVTLAASEMQRRGMVRYSRGDIQVLDVAALRATACGCYAADKRIYARVLGRVPE